MEYSPTAMNFTKELAVLERGDKLVPLIFRVKERTPWRSA
ncbi:hypothetical protein NOC27_3323 [Nitrosococcus oceani AFC27]|nr:hypothetical protein NOC27_3323 [Nitrosococcus oceani AFC27]